MPDSRSAPRSWLPYAAGIAVSALLTNRVAAENFSVPAGLVVVAADAQCSLIEAIENANAGAQTHTDCPAGSLPPAGTYTRPSMTTAPRPWRAVGIGSFAIHRLPAGSYISVALKMRKGLSPPKT